MVAFGVSGLASGIDTKSLIEKLIDSERGSARVAESRRSVVQARLDAVRTFNSKTLAFRDALDRLRTTGDAFSGRSATSADATKLQAVATSTATTGSYSLSVERMAQASEIATQGQASSSFDYTVGDIKLKLTGGSEVTIANTATKLSDVAATINAANAGVSASVISDGALNRLIVRSTATGVAAGIEYIRGNDAADNLFRDGAGVATVSSLTSAQDASIRVGGTGGFGVPGGGTGGMLVTRASNTVSDLLPGVTLTLKAGANNVQVDVGQDTTALRSAVQKLVDTYNDARSFFTSNAGFDAASRKSGALFNDRDLYRDLETASEAMTGSVGTAPSGYQKLTDFGITLGTDGKLAFDSAKLDQKLAADPKSVRTTIQTISDSVGTALASLTDSTSGLGKSRDQLLADSVSQLDARIKRLDERLVQRKAYYEAKFLSMEKLTAQFQAQGNSLSNFVTGLSKSSK